MTITVLNAQNGVYQHTPTGFTIHDAYSIKDLVDANGALAYDHADPTKWAWVAGRDLRDEIKVYNATSLATLASRLLRKYQFSEQQIVFSGIGAADRYSSWNSINVIVPGMRFESRSGTTPRIFALVNNLGAGRGISDALAESDVNSSGRLKFPFSLTWDGDNVPNAVHDENPAMTGLGGINGSTLRAGVIVPPGFIGRGIVNLPLGTWAELFTAWADAVPYKTEPAMASRITAALSAITSTWCVDRFGAVPVIKVPVAFFTDGTVGIESPIIPATFFGSVPRDYFYSLYALPSLHERSTGMWQTNPLGFAKTGFTVKMRHSNTSGDIDATMDPDGSAYENSTEVCTAAVSVCGSIDSTPVFKTLGGLYPRVASGNYARSAAITAVTEYAGTDKLPPAQGGTAAQDYEDALVAGTVGSGDNPLRYLPTTWAFAGQSAATVLEILNDELQSSAKRPLALALLHASGHYAAALRVPTTGQTDVIDLSARAKLDYVRQKSVIYPQWEVD